MLWAMRIAALGDAHLGRSAYPATTPDGVNQRERDFEESFEAAIELCLAQVPDAVLWLGDVFDHPRPSYRSFRVVMRALQRLRDHGAPLVAISGNHDTPRLPGTGNPYAVLADAFPEFRFAYRMAYESVDLGGTRIHCVPQTRTAEDSVAALREADANRHADLTNVLLTHPLVHGIERRYADINEIEVDAGDLRADLVLLGHYHFSMRVKEGVWYAGSTDTFGFGDDPDRPKGVVTLDTETGAFRHVPLTGQRRLASPSPISAWGRGTAEIQRELCETVAALGPGSVVRLELDGIEPEAYRMIDTAAVLDAGRHLLHVRLEPRFVRAGTIVDELPELATMAVRWRHYVDEQPIDDNEKAKVAATGEEYLDAAVEAALDPASDQ